MNQKMKFTVKEIKKTLAGAIVITMLMVLPLGFWGGLYPQLTLVKGTYSVTGETKEWNSLSTNEKQKRIINAEGGKVEIKSGLAEYLKKASGRKSE